MNIARIQTSCEHWKSIAVTRRKVVETKQRHIGRLLRRTEESKSKLAAANARTAALEADLAYTATAVVPLPVSVMSPEVALVGDLFDYYCVWA